MSVKNIFKDWFKSEDGARAAPGSSVSSSAPTHAPAASNSQERAHSGRDDKALERASRVLTARWQTEKAVGQEQRGIYAFAVARSANARMVAQAFQQLTGAPATRVNMLWRYPKRGGRGVVKKSRQKLARITAAKGTTVNFPSETSKSSRV